MNKICLYLFSIILFSFIVFGWTDIPPTAPSFQGGYIYYGSFNSANVACEDINVSVYSYSNNRFLGSALTYISIYNATFPNIELPWDDPTTSSDEGIIYDYTGEYVFLKVNGINITNIQTNIESDPVISANRIISPGTPARVNINRNDENIHYGSGLQIMAANDGSRPNVNLNSPNSVLYRTNSVNFIFNVNDNTCIKNCSLFLYSNRGETKYSVNEPSIGENQVSLSNLDESIYLWNVKCFDYSELYGYSSTNYSFFIDLSKPNIKLITPMDNYIWEISSNVIFSFNGSDLVSNISSCNLIVNSSLVKTELINKFNKIINISYQLNNGNYNWKINCTDNAQRNNQTASRNLVVHYCTTETCNNLDDDCDGLIDEGLDIDNDGYTPCAIPYSDCNDNNYTIHPYATEVCNFIDDDCDGLIDEGLDLDNDHFLSCENDCNNTNNRIYPSAREKCNNIDDNCNNLIDDGFDLDFDEYTTCSLPIPDCNDNNNQVYPNALESCNGIDDDCDSLIDEGFDTDNDGYTICSVPLIDCNESNPQIHPGATESCNQIDDDCDTFIDEGFDLDGDGFKSCSMPINDCNDNNAAIKPGATETCNNLDDDCDGSIDESLNITCGSDIGECVAGLKTCSIGNWSLCVGEIIPINETCNNKDDDCDGSIDEISGCGNEIVIIAESFDGETTDFENVNLSNIENLVLEITSYGKIVFNDPISFTHSVNLDDLVKIGHGYATIYSDLLPELDKEATVYFYNIQYQNYDLLIDDVICSTSICNEVSYENGIYVFDVDHFTTYSLQGKCEDGFAYSTCSIEKPKYCEEGTIVNSCSQCGCADGYLCSNGNCVINSYITEGGSGSEKNVSIGINETKINDADITTEKETVLKKTNATNIFNKIANVFTKEKKSANLSQKGTINAEENTKIILLIMIILLIIGFSVYVLFFRKRKE